MLLKRRITAAIHVQERHTLRGRKSFRVQFSRCRNVTVFRASLFLQSPTSQNKASKLVNSSLLNMPLCPLSCLFQAVIQAITTRLWRIDRRRCTLSPNDRVLARLDAKPRAFTRVNSPSARPKFNPTAGDVENTFLYHMCFPRCCASCCIRSWPPTNG